ncbi:MAG: hypothetical protein WBB43_18110 [Limnoraphis sp.]
MVRISWNANPARKLAEKDEAVKTSLRAIYSQITAQFVDYNMQGEQQAKTTVQTGEGISMEFKTKDNMHSEICAIKYMLEQNKWHVAYGKIKKRNGMDVASNEFTTSLCHCGFCTVTLQVLGLPLGQPTTGNYNLANNYNYPLPQVLSQDPFVFVRYQQSGSYEHRFLKQALNPFINNNRDAWVLKINDNLYVDDNGLVADRNGKLVLDWSDVIQNHSNCMREIWTQIWRCLYEINRDQG